MELGSVHLARPEAVSYVRLSTVSRVTFLRSAHIAAALAAGTGYANMALEA